MNKVLFSGQSRTTVKKPAVSAADHGTVTIRMVSPDDTGLDLEGVAPHPTAEHLFAGAWSACYITAVSLVAMQAKQALPEGFAVVLDVDLGQKGASWLLRATMNVHLPGMDQAAAEKLAHAADAICPYSNAVRGNINVNLVVSVGEPVLA